MANDTKFDKGQKEIKMIGLHESITRGYRTIDRLILKRTNIAGYIFLMYY